MTRCLLVDDDAAIRALLVGYLAQHGMQAEALADGAALRRQLPRRRGRRAGARPDAARRQRPRTVPMGEAATPCAAGHHAHRIHVEVDRSNTTATSFSNTLKTSQLAFPVATSQAVFATSGCNGSAANLAAVNFSSDGIFSDGVSTQLAGITGNTSDGFVATLQVGVSV